MTMKTKKTFFHRRPPASVGVPLTLEEFDRWAQADPLIRWDRRGEVNVLYQRLCRQMTDDERMTFSLEADRIKRGLATRERYRELAAALRQRLFPQ